ncbi:receptor-like protein 33 [Rhododendron vialii]|uniref:receptor-like protein 33 n=1 Tax=Rhododendron vialii TaxID=182163 RepID=UPI00265E95D5|nr:receptor-like protein 33 [Rhododendron vialii]
MEPLGTWLFQFLLCLLQYQVAAASSSSPLSSFASSAHLLCRHDQRSALLQFKHVFTIDSAASFECYEESYPKTLSWDENATDCCDWNGVTCDGLTGRVVGLDLSCSQLYGTIHPNSSLFQLSHLQRLNLAHNFINSSIPYAFGNLASLTHLNLSFSAFSGSIPSELSLLSKSISLDLSSFRLKLERLHFEILVKNLTQLQELFLYGVSISSYLPDSLTNLTSLTALDLSSTGLLGNLPDSIGYLKSLNYLNLAMCKLRGSIPKSLGNLTQIHELDLSENGFSGEVPSTLSNLKQLTQLIFYSNNFEGSISAFVELPMLKHLDLQDNNFSGGFPLWVVNSKPLVYLQEFSLSHNSLSGVIPPWLFTLPSLEYLDLSSNRLTSQIPEFQHDLPLDSLDLSDNKLRGPIPKSISTLANLTKLFLASNDLSGVVDMQTLKNVEYLDLSNTNLSMLARSSVNTTIPNLRVFYLSSCNIEVFPDFLRTSENLEKLDLSNNRIHGQIPNWVGFIGKASLWYLNLSHNFLTDIKQLPWEKLDTLDLRSNLLQGQLPIPPPLMRNFFISNNSLSGEIPSLICNASSLNILDLSHNKLSGAVPQCLGNFSSFLTVLNLRSNGFKGTLPLAFAKPNTLRSLDLSGNQFEGPLPRSLTNCRSLEVLNVGNNKINDTFPYWLGTLPELQVLVVRSNRFHGPINTMMSEFSFPKVRILDLSYNEFIGHLPGWYFENFRAMKNNTKPDEQYMSDTSGYYHDSLIVTMKGSEIELVRILTIFTTIDLSSNNFSGEIPNAVGKLNSLIVLNFSHNNLMGHIPESVGDLTRIESLDLSSNHLTGRIPSQLTSLTFLVVLNLSWNCLHGPIPHGRQFNTFDSSSYAGNIGLCGFPLSKYCEDNRTKVQPPVLQQEEDDSNFDEFTWKIVVIGYGCGMTLGLFLGSLMLLIGRPKFFVRFAEIQMPKKVTRSRRMVGDTTDSIHVFYELETNCFQVATK